MYKISILNCLRKENETEASMPSNLRIKSFLKIGMLHWRVCIQPSFPVYRRVSAKFRCIFKETDSRLFDAWNYISFISEFYYLQLVQIDSSGLDAYDNFETRALSHDCKSPLSLFFFISRIAYFGHTTAKNRFHDDIITCDKNNV